MAAHRVIALVLDGVMLLDLAAPTHLFGVCGAPHYRFDVATPTPGAVRSSTGLLLHVGRGLAALRSADTVVVPGYVDDGADLDPTILAALRAAYRRGARVMSICTGAFALARAGLLDGREATTHWASCARLASEHPLIRVQANTLYVDQGQILTSAGVAAGLDLCLHVIRRDLGASAAAAVARRTVIAPHRDGGQAQFVAAPVPTSSSGSLAPTREWATWHLADDLSVARLAGHAAVSTRTFLRRFRAETGRTPAAWVTAQRIAAARVLLETGDESMDRVAQACGLGTAESLRVHFRAAVGTTPSAYRRAFAESS